MSGATISTHVLDTGIGRPADGLPISLERVGDGATIARATTDSEGRVKELAASLDPGQYRLVFDVGAYYRAKSVPGRYFDRVALDLEIASGHHHIPLLLARYGITAYRGG